MSRATYGMSWVVGGGQNNAWFQFGHFMSRGLGALSDPLGVSVGIGRVIETSS